MNGVSRILRSSSRALQGVHHGFTAFLDFPDAGGVEVESPEEDGVKSRKAQSQQQKMKDKENGFKGLPGAIPRLWKWGPMGCLGDFVYSGNAFRLKVLALDLADLRGGSEPASFFLDAHLWR